MSDSEEKKPARSGLGWFPKLILWAAVIGFGYVYLSSVDREGGGTTASSLLNSIAKLSPVPLSSLPGFSDKEESTAESTEVAQADEAPKTETAAKPVAQTESSAKPTESTETPKTSEVSKPVPQPPVSYAAAALKAPAEPTPAPSTPAPDETAKPAPTPVATAVSSPVEQPASASVAAASKAPAPMATFAVAPPQAAPVSGQPAPVPSVVTTAPAAGVTSAVSDANGNLSPDVAEILVIGTGAGLGFLASGFIMNAWIAPVASSLATTLGLSADGVGIVTGSVTTIGILSGTYVGGVYARNLVAN